MSERKILLDERHLPEREGFLGSKITSMGADGSILKEVKTPFCDCCGILLKEVNPALCSCHRKICPSCTIIHENRAYCRECAKQIIAVTKQDFFILYGLAHETSLSDIKGISAMSSDALEESLSALYERGLVESEGIFIFTHYSVTDKGLAVLATAEQIYRREGDASNFIAKIQEASVDR
ncbi:MAG: MarR family transcriptional regulator [Candidatus Bathyarchaeota archaeon]|nr:MarR family transcriptional regulator [Candidatus Bathyarchaeota archaeon]